MSPVPKPRDILLIGFFLILLGLTPSVKIIMNGKNNVKRKMKKKFYIFNIKSILVLYFLYLSSFFLHSDSEVLRFGGLINFSNILDNALLAHTNQNPRHRGANFFASVSKMFFEQKRNNLSDNFSRRPFLRGNKKSKISNIKSQFSCVIPFQNIYSLAV